MKNENNEKIELSANQQNCGLARPEDFKVIATYDPDYLGGLPFHGQRGDTLSEYRALLKQRGTNRPKDESPYDSRPKIPVTNTAGGGSK